MSNLQDQQVKKPQSSLTYFSIGIALFAVWFSVYSIIEPMAKFITYDVFSINKNTPIGDSIEFFCMTQRKFSYFLS